MTTESQRKCIACGGKPAYERWCCADGPAFCDGCFGAHQESAHPDAPEPGALSVDAQESLRRLAEGWHGPDDDVPDGALVELRDARLVTSLELRPPGRLRDDLVDRAFAWALTQDGADVAAKLASPEPERLHTGPGSWREDKTFLMALAADPITMAGFGAAEVDLVHQIAFQFWNRGYRDLDHELQAGAAAELDDEVLDRELQGRVERRGNHSEIVEEAIGEALRLAHAGQIDGAVMLFHYAAGRQAFVVKDLSSFNVTSLCTMLIGLGNNLAAQWMEREVHGQPNLPTALEAVPPPGPRPVSEQPGNEPPRPPEIDD